MANKSFSKKSTILQFSKKILRAFVIFFVLFFFLTYFLFPYSIVKDYLISAIRLNFIENGEMLNVEIGSLKPYWFTGIELDKVSVQSIFANQRHPIEIEKMNVRLSFLPLLIGRASFNANVYQDGGTGHVFASVPLFSLLRGNVQNFEVEATFNHFEIESILDLYFGTLQNSNNPSLAMLVPVITNTSVGGYLNGTVHVEEGTTKTGFVNLNLEKSYLLIDDPALNIPLQHFKQMAADFSWENGKYTIKENTAVESENVFLKPKGDVQVMGKGRLAMPVLNLDILLILSGSIEKNFGFLIPQLLECPSTAMVDGVLNVRLTGPISQYICQ